MLREFLTSNWQYWGKLRASTTAHLFYFGQFVFKVVFSCTVTVVCFVFVGQPLHP